MAFEHIVLIEKKESATEEKLNSFLEAAEQLKDKVPGILDVKSGENFTDRTPHSHALIVTMADKDALAGSAPPAPLGHFPDSPEEMLKPNA